MQLPPSTSEENKHKHLPSAASKCALDFNISVQDIQRKRDRLICREKMVFDCVAAQTNPTFENVIVPLAMQDNEARTDVCLVSLFQYVSEDRDVRIASAEADESIYAHRTELFAREDVYKYVHEIYKNMDNTPALEDEDRRLVALYEQMFRSYGVGLDQIKRERVTEIFKRLTELEIRFMRNISDDHTTILFTREELKGLGHGFIDACETCVDDEKEKIIVPLNHSEYLSVLAYATNSSTRKRMYAAYKTKCPDNIPLLEEAIRLRLEKAQLLGYSTHARLALDGMVAKTPENVLRMLEDLWSKMKKRFQERVDELAVIKEIDAKHAMEPNGELFSWDIGFYLNLNSEFEYGYKASEIEDYFPVKHTVEALLEIFQQMLGVRIIRACAASVWHPDVEAYEVWEKSEPVFLGHFYLDLYARKSKYAGPTMLPIRTGYQKPDGTREYPAAALLTGFTKPTPTRPTLLDHDDLETIVHELGHVFHEICSLTKWSRFHGIRVEHDFSEAPSQMMENWCRDLSVLTRISSHYETGQAIPSDLVQAMVKDKNDGAFVDRMANIFYSLYDMAIHNTTDVANMDVVALYNSMRRDISLFNDGDLHTFGVATDDSFMDNYNAECYCYLWSEVYSADMFASRFLAEGLDNEKTGMDYRREILQPGASRDPLLGLELFLGRKPNSDAFLRLISPPDPDSDLE
ncbi:metalloendopeptidase [Coemansia sp. BCRC 34490]|nr:metalloendopeptidase [Coemansia sp. BCRC 34490]